MIALKKKRNWKEHKKTRISLIKDIITQLRAGTKDRHEETLKTHTVFGPTNETGILEYYHFIGS
jgi:hypothetical protein